MARFLALDWDQNILHVVSAEIRGANVQVQKAALWSEKHVPNPAEVEELGRTLRDRLKEAGIAPAPVLACIGRDRLIVKEVRFPAVPAAEEPAIVRFQAVKELTDAAEDVVIDYVVTGTLATGEQKASALVVRREVVETYRKICEVAGLKLQALTPRLIGVTACLRKVIGTTVVTPPPEPADGVICTVVVGEKLAELSIIRGQSFLLARSVPVGANLAGEIRRNLSVHAGQQQNAPVVAVYLAGKGSGELRERVAELVEIPVHTFDPFGGTETPHLPTGNRGTFAGAVGLLHVKAAGEMPVNFISPRQGKPQTNPNYRLARLGLVAGVLLLVGLFALGRILHAAWSDDLAAVQQQIEDTDRKVKVAKEQGKRLKALNDWDTPVWLDEAYDLNARIPDVNSLRITRLSLEPLPPTLQTKAAAKLTIEGKLLDKSDPRRPLNQLVTQFRKDGFYSPEAPTVQNDVFTLVVYSERRAPGTYTISLAEPKVAEPRAKAGKGKAWPGMGKFGKGAGEGKDKGKDRAKDEKAEKAEKDGAGKDKAKGSENAEPSEEAGEEAGNDVP